MSCENCDVAKRLTKEARQSLEKLDPDFISRWVIYPHQVREVLCPLMKAGRANSPERCGSVVENCASHMGGAIGHTALWTWLLRDWADREILGNKRGKDEERGGDFDTFMEEWSGSVELEEVRTPGGKVSRGKEGASQGRGRGRRGEDGRPHPGGMQVPRVVSFMDRESLDPGTEPSGESPLGVFEEGW
jgi:hypothetical protein